MCYSMLLGIAVVAMVVNPFFGAPQVFVVFKYLIGCIVEVFFIASKLAHAAQKGYAHKGIVDPNSFVVRPNARYGAIF